MSAQKHFLIITGPGCSYCTKAKTLLTEEGHTYHEVNMMDSVEAMDIMTKFGLKTVPQIFELIGGHDALACYMGRV